MAKIVDFNSRAKEIRQGKEIQEGLSVKMNIEAFHTLAQQMIARKESVEQVYHALIIASAYLLHQSTDSATRRRVADRIALTYPEVVEQIAKPRNKK